MSSQAFRECWFRYIKLSDEEKQDFMNKLNLTEVKRHDPVEYLTHDPGGPGWYFWNEIWVDNYGPFNTEEEAREALNKYCVEELGLDIP